MKDRLSYKGVVKLDTMKKGRRINTTTHNTGLPDMSWLFAKAITGNLDSSNDVPRVLDLGYIIPGTGGIWTSLLNTPVNIGGRQFSYDSTLQNWVGTLIGTIYYTDLNGPLIDSAVERATDGEIQLKIRMCSYSPKNRKYFAEVNISAEELMQIKELTSVIVTWYSEIIPEENEDSINAGIINDGTATE